MYFLQLASQRHCDIGCRPIAPCNMSFLRCTTQLCCSPNGCLKQNFVLLFATISYLFIVAIPSNIDSSQLTMQSYIRRMRRLRFASLKVASDVANCGGRCRLQKSMLGVKKLFCNPFICHCDATCCERLHCVTLARPEVANEKWLPIEIMILIVFCQLSEI